jgi:hypothetical protein
MVKVMAFSFLFGMFFHYTVCISDVNPFVGLHATPDGQAAISVSVSIFKMFLRLVLLD